MIIQSPNPIGSIIIFYFYNGLINCHFLGTYLKILYVLFHQVSFMGNHHRSANCVQVSEMQFTVTFIHIEWCLQLNVTTERRFSFCMLNGENENMLLG